MIYTDLSKAFDRIHHRILATFGFSQNNFASYLSNRSQYVTLNGYKSKVYDITSGVPQGSNLGPLLFLLFIIDLARILECGKFLYADDFN